MQYIINNKLELTEENYPASILLNDRKEVLLIHSETTFIIATSNNKWYLTPKQLVNILEQQKEIKPNF